MSADEVSGQPPVWRIPLLGFTLFAWLPVLIVATGQLAAWALGCTADGFQRPCTRWGVELGGVLRGAYSMIWFVQITALPMVLTLLVWLAIGVRRLWQ